MSFVDIKALEKTYGSNRVVQGVALSIARGEFVSLLGPSGCGKTTVLRMVAGLETATAGQILFDGEDVTDTNPAARGVGMVFQAYALFPNMTVADNIAFGLKVAGKPSAQIKTRVSEMLDLIKLPQLASRYPYQLSGGQQQRVAVARALAPSPRILLLDEPLSALDAKIRHALREEIRAVQKALGITTIFVTHDQEEALSISDKIVVMSEGRIEQMGSPEDIYSRPATRFVAEFVGKLSTLRATVTDRDAGLLSLGRQTLTAASINGHALGSTVELAVRPEAIVLDAAPGTSNSLDVAVKSVQFLGAIRCIEVDCDGQMLTLDTLNRAAGPRLSPGDRISIAIAPQDAVILHR